MKKNNNQTKTTQNSWTSEKYFPLRFDFFFFNEITVSSNNKSNNGFKFWTFQKVP